MLRYAAVILAAIVAVGLALVAARTVGAVTLDRPSSDITFNAGSLNVAGGEFITTAPWNVNRGFQISMLGEDAGPPPNAEWNINHYAPGGTSYDWTHYNYADYPYYHLELNTTGSVPASFYTDGPTGELLDWALYYTDSTGSVQTIFGGTIENPQIQPDGTFTAYLRIQPYCTYRTFDGTGEGGTVNDVETWDGIGLLTDLVGYEISAPGAVVGDTWTSSGAMTLQPDAVPEPVTMASLALAVVGLGGYLRRRLAAR